MQGDISQASTVFAANRARGAVRFGVHLRDGVTGRGDLHESGSLRVRFPSPEGDGLSAVFVNTAGGVTGGDRFDIEIAAQEGARLTLTAVHGMEKRGGSRALATMCVGVGQGVSLALERV